MRLISKCEVINTHGYIEFNVGVVTGGWIPGIPDNSKLTLDLDSGSSHPAGYVNDSFHIITNVGYCNVFGVIYVVTIHICLRTFHVPQYYTHTHTHTY